MIGLSAIVVLPGARARPPSSLEPEKTDASVVFRHRHQRVRSCSATRSGNELRCDASTVRAEARTQLKLVPVRARSLDPERDGREQVSVFIGSNGTSGGVPLAISPGTWEIVWVDSAPSATMTLARGGTATVSLASVTGRCEKKQGTCVLAPRPVARTVDVAVQ
jgi:hypothetical protein